MRPTVRCALATQGICNKEVQQESVFTNRMKAQGVVCRLVAYNYGEMPSYDIHLTGGSGKPIVVSAILPDGRAARSGVRRGDRLVSINGAKDFLQSSGSGLMASLRPPATLIFMGFEGPLNSEVHLLENAVCCGMPSNMHVIHRLPDLFHVCEETVFEPGSASIFLATTNNDEAGKLPDRPRASSKLQPDSGAKAIFELHREDARRLVEKARLPPVNQFQKTANDLSQDELMSIMRFVSKVEAETLASMTASGLPLMRSLPTDSYFPPESTFQRIQPSSGDEGAATPKLDFAAM